MVPPSPRSPQPPVPSAPVPGVEPLRVASYNVRVDHTDDLGTEHDWALRRPLVASSIAALRADVIGLQEPSPVQAEHMQEDLGDEWGVAVLACDPEAWAAAPAAEGPAAQARDGNGIAWRRARLALLSEVEELPLPSDSGFKRSCVVARMRDRITGSVICLLSAHFDHAGDDAPGCGSGGARLQSASLVMARARAELASADGADAVLVMGDFNTFLDRRGACYDALCRGAADELQDVRDLGPEVDAGRADSSWEGWEDNAYARIHKGNQRYDQLFVSGGVRVLRSSVPEERFQQGAGWVYASDHLPIVADLQLPAPRAAGAVARWRGAAAAAGGLASALVVIVCVSLLRGRK